MTKKQKKELRRLLIAFAVFILACLLRLSTLPNLVLLAVFLLAYVLAGGDVVLRAVRNILHGQVFDENFLMSLATIGAFFVGDYPEGVAVMLFYQVGELFQSYAVGKSRKSITSLMQIRPDSANLLKDGVVTEVDPELVSVGDIIVVKPGERIPLDGIITEGSSSLDTAALTGEAMPREVAAGDDAISGCINLQGTLHIRVTKEFGESTVSRILDMVENASSQKAKAENFITKFARYYTPIVVLLAAALAILPPLILQESFSGWIYRALNFLVVSCPCALVISIPLGFFGGIGGAAKQGILMKGSNYLEALAQVDTFVFDKTGTLTKGNFKVTKTAPVNISAEELLFLTAHAEADSSHPIALSVIDAYETASGKKPAIYGVVSKVQEIAGFGVSAVVSGKEVLVGNARLLSERGISYSPADFTGTIVYVAVNGVFAGWIGIEDEMKPDAKAAIKGLSAVGVKRTVMLTGDKKEVGEKIAAELGLNEVHTELLPADKVTWLEKLLSEKTNGKKLAFVGDGINDAPVLARADVGIAMGGLGSDAAIEAADIVIMTDEPSKLPAAIRIARRTLSIVHQNVVFAIAVKVLVLILSALGHATMWWAVFADVGVCVLAILNSMRALR
ncbi:MAG: heavy metal translocating P-type ATPase [Lachnospiraceae bacterium]